MGILDSVLGGSTGPEIVNGVSAFEIRALSSGKILRLQGRGLPHRPFTLETTQRAELTWLPGYAQAVMQIGGPTEEPTTINGKWSDKWLAESDQAALDLGPLGNSFAAVDNAIGAAGARVGLGSSNTTKTKEIIAVTWANQRIQTASAACDVVDELVRTGALVEVVWDRVARRGIIQKFRKSWLNSHDVEWEMEFLWTGRAEAEKPVSTPELGVGDTVSLLQQLADTLGTEALPPTFPMANDVLSDVNAGILRISATTQAISDTVVNITDLALSPISTARSLVALYSTLRGQARDLRDTLRSRMPSGLRKSGTGTNVQQGARTGVAPGQVVPEASASYTDKLVSALYVATVSSTLKQIESTSAVAADEHQRKLDRQVVTTVTAKAGQDLRSLSQEFYGTPNEWKRIAQANGLRSAALVAGLQISIPRLTDGELC